MHAMCPNFFNIPLLTKIRSTLFIHFRNYWYSNKRSNYFEFIYAIISGASPGFGRGGGQELFFQIWKPCAWLGGFGGMPPRENFLK